MIAKFTGKFKDLIPNGFKFQKLYARNYRTYCWQPTQYSPESIWIWQHHGGYVEINDLGIYSALIFDLFSKPEELEFFQRHYKSTDKKFYEFVINRATNSIEQYDATKHDIFHLFMMREDGKITEQEYNEKIEYIGANYRKVIIMKGSWLHNAIKTILDNNWVEIKL